MENSAGPLVSVIVPCYNYSAFLPEALESLIKQTYQNWECLIVDDGSTDNSPEVAKHYVLIDNRIKYIHQPNGGLSSARNTGLKAAKGEYIQLLDADDLLESEKLRLQVAYLEENKSVDLIYSGVQLFRMRDKNRTFETFKFNEKPVSGKKEMLFKSLVNDNFFLPGCPLAKRSFFKDTGDFDPALRAFEDWHYWYRAALLGKEFQYDNREGVRLMARSHNSNMSKQRQRMWTAKIKARTDLMERTAAYIKTNNLEKEPAMAEVMAKHKILLHRDKARFEALFGNVLIGFGNAVKHAMYSGKPGYALYDAAYWMKERAKNALK